MKYVKSVLLLATIFVMCSSFFNLRPHKSVYIFGLSASFTDTVVYCTEIQLLDSVYLDGNGFLPYRDHYSYQMKNYLEFEKGLSNRTCMVYFSTNLKKLNKEYAKIVGKYRKDKHANLQMLTQEDLVFTKPDYE